MSGSSSPPHPAALRCRICGHGEGHRRFRAREMVLGLREEFDYLECGDCGTLQIVEVPGDLERYYGSGYYSFAPPRRAPFLRRWLKRRLAAHHLGRWDPLGRMIAARRGLPREIDWVRRAGAGRDAAILDVGAGGGQLLLTLRDYGFRRLQGIDPFLAGDLVDPCGVRVLKRSLDEVEGRFDLVMFHHSFEHLPEPAAALAAARRLLVPGGCILIRTPIAAESWRRYGSCWVELDAPRHLHVLTVAGLERLAGRVGLRVADVAWDTTSFELAGSERYRRDVALAERRPTDFTTAERQRFEARAQELNASGQAGRGAFWLRPAEEKEPRG